MAGLALVGAAPTPVAAATSTAQVAVEFSPGNVVTRSVSFSEASISGIEALQRAGFSVEVYGYSGIGAAVCRIDGVGRAPSASCLSGGSDAWVYWRNGAYSRAGGGATRVGDGDREGWVWGNADDGPPAFAPPPTTAPPATQPPPPPTAPPTTPAPQGGRAEPTATTAGPGATTAPAGSKATTTKPAGRTPTTTGSPGEAVDAGPAGTAASQGADTEEVAGQPLANERAGGDDGGGGPLALAGFALVLAAVIGLTVRARLARRGP